MILPRLTSNAPTIGLGEVNPYARLASANAFRM